MNHRILFAAGLAFLSAALAIAGVTLRWPPAPESPSIVPLAYSMARTPEEPIFSERYETFRKALLTLDPDTSHCPATWHALAKLRQATDEGKMQGETPISQMMIEHLVTNCLREESMLHHQVANHIHLLPTLVASVLTLLAGMIFLRLATQLKQRGQQLAEVCPEVARLPFSHQLDWMLHDNKALSESLNHCKRRIHEDRAEHRAQIADYEARIEYLLGLLNNLPPDDPHPPETRCASPCAEPEAASGSENPATEEDSDFPLISSLAALRQTPHTQIIGFAIQDADMLWHTYGSDDPIRTIASHMAATLCRLEYASLSELCYEDNILYWAAASDISADQIATRFRLQFRSEPLFYRGEQLTHPNIEIFPLGGQPRGTTGSTGSG